MTPQMSKSIHSGQVPLPDKVGILGSKKLTKNDEKMIDLESIQIHSSIVQGPPGYQKMTRRAYFLHRKCSIRVIRGQGGPSLRTRKLRHRD